MKKNLIIAGLTAVTLIAAAFAYRPVTEYLTEKPVNKSIAFSVYRDTNYNSEVYDQTSAKVHIVVEKVSKHGRKIVWENTIDARSLKQYPTADKAISQKIIVPGIFERKEHLEVKYFLIYDTKGTELEMQNGSVVSKGVKAEKLDINI